MNFFNLFSNICTPMKFVFFVVFLLTTNGYHCDCTPTGINVDNEFIPSNCSVTTNSVCFSSDLEFSSVLLKINTIVVTNNTKFYSDFDKNWQNTQTLQIAKDMKLLCVINLKIIETPIIKPNATINLINYTSVFGRMSIAGNLTLIDPELNNPRIIIWNSTYLQLTFNYSDKPDFDIVNPTGDTKCFDVISLNENYNLDTSTNQDHITSDIFEYSYNFKTGKGYLMSNKKLIRFCPNNTPLDKEVVCILKQNNYTTYTSTMEGAFDYPHCPCNEDLNVNCNLKFASGLTWVDMSDYYYYFYNTELLIEKDIFLKIQTMDYFKQSLFMIM
ncbi:hypothetical protein EIN_204450 [Entamoeba invadens IP1]|uniref:Protein kinase domain containing protein n=1 Tax=Entamoeba invadens IP1 TaxID=370355 RepID=L7FLU8_ENTIV|nr:hypothetical protein EIN_204450 [Entamoeba invadens IP1]ELP89110.1 hypothetical protein EIN_204450 [Entamoeba invadens IP1]|eukprot:XP_004255881.1 hypothetical protein EIN_204450 [Entamoeba invadens IP1]